MTGRQAKAGFFSSGAAVDMIEAWLPQVKEVLDIIVETVEEMCNKEVVTQLFLFFLFYSCAG